MHFSRLTSVLKFRCQYHLGKCLPRNYASILLRRVSPAAHFTVHDGRRVKVSQQVIHQVVVLLLSLYYPIIAGHMRPQRVLHQLLQALLLALTVPLQQASVLPSLEITWKRRTTGLNTEDDTVRDDVKQQWCKPVYLRGQLAAPTGNASWRTRRRGTSEPWSSISARTYSGRRTTTRSVIASLQDRRRSSRGAATNRCERFFFSGHNEAMG